MVYSVIIRIQIQKKYHNVLLSLSQKGLRTKISLYKNESKLTARPELGMYRVLPITKLTARLQFYFSELGATFIVSMYVLYN